jgi:hypothetical protein
LTVQVVSNQEPRKEHFQLLRTARQEEVDASKRALRQQRLAALEAGRQAWNSKLKQPCLNALPS